MIPTIAQHLEQARGPQARVLLEGLLDEFEKGIGGTRGEDARLVERVCCQGAFDGVGMQTEFTSDGSDFPMLDEEEAANFGKLFRRDQVLT